MIHLSCIANYISNWVCYFNYSEYYFIKWIECSTIAVMWMSYLNWQDKKSLKLGPEDNLYIEGFASNVFAKADKQDRAGRADLYHSPLSFFVLKFQIRLQFFASLVLQALVNNFSNCRNTAKTFYAASIFFEILNQFGELQPDVSLISLFLRSFF